MLIKLNFLSLRESLKEAILLANSEELTNITANSYIFMGQIDKLLNSFQESFDMVTNGLDMAEKMPDINLKMFANSILKGKFTKNMYVESFICFKIFKRLYWSLFWFAFNSIPNFFQSNLII